MLILLEYADTVRTQRNQVGISSQNVRLSGKKEETALEATGSTRNHRIGPPLRSRPSWPSPQLTGWRQQRGKATLEDLGHLGDLVTIGRNCPSGW